MDIVRCMLCRSLAQVQNKGTHLVPQFYVHCTVCTNAGNIRQSKSQAIMAWNDLNTPRAWVARPAAAQAPV